MVVLAAGVSSVAIAAGSFAVVPGLFLMAIWPVVAQAAALESGGPIAALRRSTELTRGHRWHALGLVLLAGLIAALPWLPAFLAFHHSGTTGASFALGTAAQVLLRSFEALITALLYFDLKARLRARSARTATQSYYVEPRTTGRHHSPTGHPLDPANWTDEERPAGWYIDPGAPANMHYWAADRDRVWSRHTAKTPKATLAEWREVSSGS